MLVRIDPGSSAPLFEQVAAAVRRALAEGEVRPGEQLPPARQLATSLDINMHTVLRAYALLRDEGLIELRRRRGAVVKGGAEAHAKLNALADELAREAKRLGVELGDLVTIVRRSYS